MSSGMTQERLFPGEINTACEKPRGQQSRGRERQGRISVDKHLQRPSLDYRGWWPKKGKWGECPSAPYIVAADAHGSGFGGGDSCTRRGAKAFWRFPVLSRGLRQLDQAGHQCLTAL